MGWVSDFFRLVWGFFYWNLRKTFYRQKWARRCPCQHPSDSGRAWETACVAVLHWNKPARFRRLCPLLERVPAGEWRCSVNRAEVRPFWGRAVVFYVSSAAVIYLTATLGAFVFLRSVGYGVTYAGVLWPPAWSKLTAIRADFFLKKAQGAAAAGDWPMVLASLSTAYDLNPRNYAAGIELARSWQVPQPGLSDRTYRRLIDDHPERAEETSRWWFRALLARGDFAAVEALAGERLAASRGEGGAWVNAFLFANHHTGNAAARRELMAVPGLSRTAEMLVRLRDELAALPPEDVRERLLAAGAGAGDALAVFHVGRELIARGFAQEALTLIEERGEVLSARDALTLRLDAMARLGWTTALRSEVESLLVARPEPVIVDLLCAHLIRYPNRDVLGRVFDRLEREPSKESREQYPVYLALFCASAASEDAWRTHWTMTRIKRILGEETSRLDAAADILLGRQRARRIGNYLPAFQPLSLDVTYALFDHYAPPRS